MPATRSWMKSVNWNWGPRHGPQTPNLRRSRGNPAPPRPPTLGAPRGTPGAPRFPPCSLPAGPLGVRSRQHGKDLHHLRLAVLHLDDEAAPVRVPLVVHVHVHEQAGLLGRREQVVVEAVA